MTFTVEIPVCLLAHFSIYFVAHFLLALEFIRAKILIIRLKCEEKRGMGAHIANLKPSLNELNNCMDKVNMRE